jgi:hypothetical protein
MSSGDANHVPEPRNFEPKNPVDLPPPKSDPISPEHLAKCNGKVSICFKTAVSKIYYLSFSSAINMPTVIQSSFPRYTPAD